MSQIEARPDTVVQPAAAHLTVPGMGSNHCAGLVTTSLERIDGVRVLATNIATHGVDVEFDLDKASLDDLKAAVERAGYDVAEAMERPSSTGRSVQLTVPGMGSDHCAGLVSNSIKRLPGIIDVGTNIASHVVTVSFEVAQVDANTIGEAIERAGYEVASVEEEGAAHVDEEIEERYLSQAWRRLWFAAIPTTLIMVLMMVHMFWVAVPEYLSIIAVLAFPVVFLQGGMATHRSAWRSLVNRTANMDVLISLGSMPRG